MTRKVLIAGASGWVGAACVDAFLDDGWDVIKGLEERFSAFCFIREFSRADAKLQAIRCC